MVRMWKLLRGTGSLRIESLKDNKLLYRMSWGKAVKS